MEETLRFACEGLPEKGVIVGSIKEEIPESLVCKYFGPKSSKSGWNFKAYTTVEEQEAIFSLYQRVYGVDDLKNKEISLQFARGLISMSLGKEVNWAQFSKDRREFREKNRKTLENNRKEKRMKEIEEGIVPSNLGKKRCSVVVSNVSFPTSFKIKMKSEDAVEGLGLGLEKKVFGKGGGRVSPRWLKEDLDNMVSTIVKTTKVVKDCEVKFSESSVKMRAVESKLRRARILLSDREALINESKEQLEAFSGEELALRAESEECAFLLSDVENSVSREAVREQFKSIEAVIEGLIFKRGLEERTIGLSSEVVQKCESQILELEDDMETSSRQNKELSERVVSLQSLLASMSQQLRLMQEDSGAVFFPTPVCQSPLVPITTVHSLNACPVCSLWFSCFDYIPLACGHTYHPFCLYEHGKSSSSCLIENCKAPFLAQHKLAIGMRPVTMTKTDAPKPVEGFLNMKVEKEVDAATISNATAETNSTRDTSPNPSSHGECDGAENQLSQSIEMNLDNNNNTAITIAMGTKDKPCFVCSKKPIAVRLKNCGHALFCFGCLSGKTKCPFCSEDITGWEPVCQKQNIMNPLLLSLGGCADIAIDTLIASGSRKKKGKPTIANILPTEPFVKEDEQICVRDSLLSLDTEDYNCEVKQFTEGSEQSMQSESIEVEDVYDRISGLNSSDNVAPTGNCEENVVEPDALVFKRKRGLIVDMENHTRIVEKTLTSICGPCLLDVPVVRKTSSITKVQVAQMKKRGRATVGSKIMASRASKEPINNGRGKARVKIVPVRFQQ